MKVILLENLMKIGSIGDIINVKRGFARNYLISRESDRKEAQNTLMPEQFPYSSH